MNEFPIVQLIYASTHTPGRITSPQATYRDILSTAQRSNAASDISGCLIFDGQTFIQLLEGDRAAIGATFERIRRDRRHRDIRVLGSQSCLHRTFAGSPMKGFVRSSALESALTDEGLTGILHPRSLDGDVVFSLAERLASFDGNSLRYT
ncbi:BLUF domain-containing protein [Bosea sp. PAMC 26642]|uniref:BLUF domain-containing protein n=1 Tax=Bosea sp. (strain PAMC 26642) TaxID=1792307 RepID=UPI0007702F11|nr:BLUF domain-containing protein [Bosea sp. PAMC 26642]AMJ62285.1 hypothetical protein AXW83_20050 [Bosea sp. PAMC 26642]